MELQALTGQLYITNGTEREVTAVPGLLAQRPPNKAARGRERDFLFAHLTLSGSPDETAVLAQDLLDSISNLFYRTSGSVTAALRKAIIETNKHLLALNLSGSVKRRHGALSCVVLRGEEMYMAQTGESFAFLGHNFGIERLPANEPSRITPMGQTAGLDIRYFHQRLQPGDLLLLADPRLAHLHPQSLRTVLIDTVVEDGLEALQRAIGSGSGRVLLLEFTDEAPDYLPEMEQSRSERPSSARPLPPPTGKPKREGQPQRPNLAARAAARVSNPLATVDADRVETSARKATSQAARGLSRFTAWLAELLARMRPAREEPADYRELALPAMLAIIIPVLVAVVISGVYVQRGQVVRYGQIKQEMDAKLSQATQVEDTATAQQLYEEVLILGQEAQTLRPADDEIIRLRQEAQTELDKIENISRLQARILYEYDEDVQLTAVALGDNLNGDIYILDQANNIVYRHQTDETFLNFLLTGPETILFGGQAVGNHIVGQIVDMMWRPQGQEVTRDGLALLDERGALLTFYPNFADVRAVPLGLSSEWQTPVAITTFNERLYILDTGTEELWRYFADGDGFVANDNQRTVTFLEDADLDQAQDVVIYQEDGSVLVLYDGRLSLYFDGRLRWDEQELVRNGLTPPLSDPVAVKVVGSGPNSSIFVADRGNGRIAQFSLGGTFLAQYKATDNATGQEIFSQISDFQVLENPLRIFVTAGNRLYAATQ